MKKEKNTPYVIGGSTIDTASGKMILVAIENENNMTVGYTDIRYNCYTYNNGKAYYWEKLQDPKGTNYRIDNDY